jgi:hypothetical protein
MKTLLALLVSGVVSSGCTGGMLIVDPIEGTTAGPGHVVKMHTSCRTFWTTTSEANGIFQFNPFDPSSTAIDPSKEIPAGRVMVFVDDMMHGWYDVDYSQTCTVARNGGWQDVPCSKAGFVLHQRRPGDPDSLYGLPLRYIPDDEQLMLMNQHWITRCIIESMG